MLTTNRKVQGWVYRLVGRLWNILEEKCGCNPRQEKARALAFSCRAYTNPTPKTALTVAKITVNTVITRTQMAEIHEEEELLMHERLLIADDEPNILLSLEYLMKREGFQVSVAHDGEEALSNIRSQRPRLVLLDVMMPKKTGLEVCQAIRADAELQDTLILMLTAKGRDTDVAKGLALGANDYMVKPFSTKELVQKVKTLLESN